MDHQLRTEFYADGRGGGGEEGRRRKKKEREKERKKEREGEIIYVFPSRLCTSPFLST